MKIIFICREFPLSEYQSTGGFGRYVDSMSRALINQGNQVTILCLGETRKRFLLPDKREVLHLPKPKLRYTLFLSSIPFLGSRLKQFFEYPLYWSFNVYKEVQKISLRENVDIIEGGDFGGELFFYLLLGKRTIPTVIKLHTPSFVIRQYNSESHNFFYRIMDMLELTSLQRVDYLSSPTRSLARIVSKKINRNIETIIPYPNPQINNVTAPVRRSKYVLFAGKFQEKKGVFTLIKAAATVIQVCPEAKFIFVGTDTKKRGKSIKKEMEVKINNFGLLKHVIIRDTVSTRDLAKFYKISLITVIPSIWENFPNVCLEAMLFKSAVIASRVGGLTEIIEHKKTGILVTPGNAAELARWIVWLLTQSKIRKKITGEAKKYVLQRFDMDQIAHKTEAFYIQCVENFNMKRT